ncbi:MAG: hypothetical protein Q9182_002625 [Xanthomendoza sp. 2 TL-2023]
MNIAMATSLARSPSNAVPPEGANGTKKDKDDPFTNTPTMQQSSRPHRYSSVNHDLFAENHPSSSPTHAKRALEAHISETERRLQEASKLGTTLVEQRQKLSARLREVELQQHQQELGPELRQRLIDIEKEYNDVGRESARAFLAPKSDPVGTTADSESSFALDGTRSGSPAKFSSRATDSPSKVNVPRKQRNQPANQVQDIQLAADISTSLLAQVRQLQTMLSEKDESLKAADLEVSRLQQESEGFAQRLRSMDESEQRYKDENWNLETQLHDLTAEQKEAATREHKVQQALTLATSEKNATLRELDDLKQTHGKAIEDHTLMRKNQDSELGSLRRDLSSGESERSSLQRKIEELTAQNQELAKAVAGRFRENPPEQAGDAGAESEAYPTDRSDTEHSPPPSPTKGGPRHSMLESETLKSSLHHAHRMIQTLKGNVHREKTEKLELKRMLQEARDELDVRRSEGSNIKRPKSKPQQDVANRAGRPNMLGAGRNSRTDITVDEPGWEDRGVDDSPQPLQDRRVDGAAPSDAPPGTEMSDAYQTANETEDGFETAQERDFPTENEAIQNGANGMAENSSEDMTETEDAVARGGTLSNKRPALLMSTKAEGLPPYTSNISVPAHDDDTALMTPNQTQTQKYRLKLIRGSRKSRLASEGIDSNPSTAKGSPASFMSTPGQGNQNLFAELDDMDAMDSSEDATPSRGLASRRSNASMRRSVSSQRTSSKRRRSVSSQASSHSGRPSTMKHSESEPPVPRLPVVDAGTMTEPWEPGPPMSNANERLPAPYETPSEMASLDMARDVKDTTSLTPHSENTQAPASSASAVDSPSTAKSTPLKTAWDQPLSMFSNIIPTFGQTVDTTPLSAKSAASRNLPADESPRSNRSSVVSFHSTDEMSIETPAGKTPTQEQTDSPPSFRRSSSSPIRGISTEPIEPHESTGRHFTVTSALPVNTNPWYSQETSSSVSTPASDYPAQRMPIADTEASPPSTIAQATYEQCLASGQSSTDRLNQGATDRILGSIFGPGPGPTQAPPPPPPPLQIAEDNTSQSLHSPSQSMNINSERALRELPPNTVQREYPTGYDVSEQHKPTPPIDTTDHSVQTLLSSEQIEKLIRQKELSDAPRIAPIPSFKPLSAIGASLPTASQKFPESQELSKQTSKDAAPYAKGIKRPISSSTIRMSNSSGTHPPLPPDHQQAIAAAAQRTGTTEPPNVMGPPLAPASAYRSNTMRPRTPSRPRTPNEQKPAVTPASQNSTTPRARYPAMRSRISRRSSVSSFESELDERFNIRLDGVPVPDGIDSGTDPRMIQAITQTMIGEFLWKYTRKAGRGEMSNNRHRRFFWIHPYTRTLYWSDRDPSTAGRAEMKAKSVAIEAVRVVSDDNPMPPGLHRKSLIVVTPGRSVKFTAQTSQRHETWFNALSYLLLRTGPEGGDNNGITPEDLAEFNPSFGNRETSRTRASRISFSSLRSRGKTPEPSTTGRSLSRHSTRQPTGVPPPSDRELREALQPPPQQHQQQEQPPSTRSRRGSNSLSQRISSYWKPNRGMSISSRTSQQSLGGASRGEGNLAAGVYRPTSSAAGSRHGSESDVSLKVGKGGGVGLENVRSCCDGT